MSKSRDTKSPDVIDEELSSAGQHRPARPNRDIALRAYELWEQRGCPEGSAEKDWANAEREIDLQETELAS